LRKLGVGRRLEGAQRELGRGVAEKTRVGNEQRGGSVSVLHELRLHF
jgi:hypothetical protein